MRAQRLNKPSRQKVISFISPFSFVYFCSLPAWILTGWYYYRQEGGRLQAVREASCRRRQAAGFRSQEAAGRVRHLSCRIHHRKTQNPSPEKSCFWILLAMTTVSVLAKLY